MALTATLYTEQAIERRDGERRPVGADSTLRSADAQPHAILLNDLSLHGCRIDATVPLVCGDMVSIGLTGVGRRNATIIRAKDGRYGCRFDVPLTPTALHAAFASDPVVEGMFGGQTPAESSHPDPVVEKWHPALRLTFLLGATSVLWGGLIKLI